MATAGNGAPPDGLWIGVSELARRKGQNKSWISRRVAKLVEDGLIETRQAPRGGKLVNLAAYDRVVGEIGDPAKEAGAATKAADGEAEAVSRDPSYRDAQTERARYEAELKKLDLGERLGKLVAVAEVEAAMDRAGAAIVRVIEVLPTRTTDVCAAFVKDGEQGVRRMLKQFVLETRQAAAAALRAIEREGKEATGEIDAELPLVGGAA